MLATIGVGGIVLLLVLAALGAFMMAEVSKRVSKAEKKIDEAETRIQQLDYMEDDLQERIEDYKADIATWKSRIQVKQNHYDKMEEEEKKLLSSNKKLKEMYNETLKECSKLLEQRTKAEEVLQEIRVERDKQIELARANLVNIQLEIEELVRLHRATEMENFVEDAFEFAPDEIDIIRQIELVAKQYPFIAREVRMALWTKIVRPKFNKMAEEYSKKSGIYKLTDPKGKIYIGKATDIKNRWSTHIKMAMGIDTNSMALYKGMKLDWWDWSFDVIDSNIDNEAHWIKYYAADVVGYNGRK